MFNYFCSIGTNSVVIKPSVSTQKAWLPIVFCKWIAKNELILIVLSLHYLVERYLKRIVIAAIVALVAESAANIVEDDLISGAVCLNQSKKKSSL